VNPTSIHWNDAAVAAIGNIDLLNQHKTGLLCSRKCPAEKILDAVDLFKDWAKEDRLVVSGFHSPVERECLKILLKSSGRAIVCPARGIGNMRIPSEWKAPIAQGRLLIVSPFDDSVRRSTALIAEKRNDFIVSLADKVVVIYAAPGSKIEQYASSGGQ
jgi:predicted Rossmann fold nucleotide-binding protein DprA/Smf involved in DNA uptake